MMLRILMCRFVFEGVLRGMREKHTGLQFLLEQTTEYTGRQNTFSKMQLVSDISAATEELRGKGEGMAGEDAWVFIQCNLDVQGERLFGTARAGSDCRG